VFKASSDIIYNSIFEIGLVGHGRYWAVLWQFIAT